MKMKEEKIKGHQKYCCFKSIFIQWKNPSKKDTCQKLAGKIALFPKYAENESFIDILVTEGTKSFLGRMHSDEIRERKLSSEKRVDLAISYLMGDFQHVTKNYELENNKSANLLQINMSIKDDYQYCDNEILKRKLWKGTLQLSKNSTIKDNVWQSVDNCVHYESNALLFVDMMEQRINCLEGKLMCAEKERDEHKKAAHEWKSNYDRFHMDSQKSIDELTSNFLILHNSTKKRLRDVMKKPGTQKAGLIKNSIHTQQKFGKQIEAKKKFEVNIDHEDEHDLETFDKMDVERFALGVAVSKNSMNPRKIQTSDLPPLVINQSIGDKKEEFSSHSSLMGEEEIDLSQWNQSSSKIKSYQSIISRAHSCKNPYTGATEVWDPTAVFSDDDDTLILDSQGTITNKNSLKFVTNRSLIEPNRKRPRGESVEERHTQKEVCFDHHQEELSEGSSDSVELL